MLQPAAEGQEHPLKCFQVLPIKAIGELIHPRGLQLHRGFIGLFSQRGQNHELGAAVARIGCEAEEIHPLKIIDDPLHILAVGTEIFGNSGYGLRLAATDDRAEDLPPGSG